MGLSRIVCWACLVASALSTGLLFVAVTMLFIFPAMNVVAIALVLGANRNAWQEPLKLRQQRIVVAAVGGLTCFLVILPWLQLAANVEVPGYREFAGWVERALQTVL